MFKTSALLSELDIFDTLRTLTTIIFEPVALKCGRMNSFEIGRVSVTRGSRRVLVKVVLLQLGGRGNLQDDALPSFFPDSRSSLIGLSNDVSLGLGFWLRGSLILENKKPVIYLFRN